MHARFSRSSQSNSRGAWSRPKSPSRAAALASFRHSSSAAHRLPRGLSGVADHERLGYGAREMLLRRPFEIATGAMLAVAMCVAVPSAIHLASAGAARLIDRDGIVHFTNVPEDPRYRGVRGTSGTAVGWFSRADLSWDLYARDIREISLQHDVDPALVQAVVRVESAFNPSAVSRKGASGLMQLMPRTASALGVLDPFDPRQNIRGGVRHLRYLLDRYRGNVAMAVAAYNAGEGAVDFHQGIPPYPETKQYVQRVLRQAGMLETLGRSPGWLYRYPGPDNSLIYSNLPPDIRR